MPIHCPHATGCANFAVRWSGSKAYLRALVPHDSSTSQITYSAGNGRYRVECNNTTSGGPHVIESSRYQTAVAGVATFLVELTDGTILQIQSQQGSGDFQCYDPGARHGVTADED